MKLPPLLKKLLKFVKKLKRKRLVIVLAIAVALLLSATAVAAHALTPQQKTVWIAKKAPEKPIAAAPDKKEDTPAKNEDKTTPSAPTKQTKPATTSPERKAAAAPARTPCEVYIPVYYTGYTSSINAEALKHLEAVAEIQRAYDELMYPGSDQVNKYYADMDAENERHAQTAAAIYGDYKSTLAAVGCYF